MRDDICTIPISEAFEPMEGCPICRMRSTVEERVIDYILGAAMMEPDVRIKTNELGFCGRHLHDMRGRRNRLALGLILESHLAHLSERITAGDKPSLLRPSPKKSRYRAAQLTETCFVCDRMEWGLQRMLDTVLRQYESDRDFRELYAKQPAFCLPHYVLLSEAGEQKLSKRTAGEFQKVTAEILARNLTELKKDVRHFCNMFDYRNAGEDADWGNARDAIERAALLLTSRED